MYRVFSAALAVVFCIWIAQAAAQRETPQPRGGQNRGGQPAQTPAQDPFGRHYWKAFIDASGEKPMLRVEGIMTAATPGHYAVVQPANPQGFNPRILLLNVSHKQLPGIWAQVQTDIPVCYQVPVEPDFYERVTLLAPGGAGKDVEVIRPSR